MLCTVTEEQVTCHHVQSALLSPTYRISEGDRKGWGRRSPRLLLPVQLEPPSMGTAVEEQEQCST